MKTSTLTRLGLTVAMSATLATMSFASHAQQGQDVSAPHKAAAQQDKQDKQEQKDDRKEAKEQQKHRLSPQEQQERIRQQKKLIAEYNQRIAQQQAIALRNASTAAAEKRSPARLSVTSVPLFISASDCSELRSATSARVNGIIGSPAFGRHGIIRATRGSSDSGRPIQKSMPSGSAISSR